MSSWTEEYWDIMSRAYWEPEKFFAARRKPLCPECEKLKAPYDASHEEIAIDGMRRRETSLNDVLNLVVRLAPSTFIPRLIEATFGETVAAGFETAGRGVSKRYGWGKTDYTQPDLMYYSPEATFSLELKALAQSKLKQAMDYAALAASEEQVSGERPHHFLTLLTPRTHMRDAFAERFNDEDELKVAMRSALEGGGGTAVPHELSHLARVVEKLRIAHLSYREFDGFLAGWCSNEIGGAAETLNKLVEGLRLELRAFGALQPRVNAFRTAK